MASAPTAPASRRMGALLKDCRDRIAALKLAGRSVEQAIAARPTAATDETMGKGFIKPTSWYGRSTRPCDRRQRGRLHRPTPSIPACDA